jgi:penicillin-binding protein-related factor A (putative recombinase)
MSDFQNESLTGSDFQAICKDRCYEYKRLGIAAVGEYGVQGVFKDGKWMPIQSLPDFEGAMASGHHMMFDCKVCSQASFSLGPYRQDTRAPKARQLKHMRDRAEFNVASFFLLHWNARLLKRSSYPPETFIFPICANRFWEQYDAAQVMSITREDCDKYGVPVPWNILGQARTFRPDFLPAVQARIENGVWETVGV